MFCRDNIPRLPGRIRKHPRSLDGLTREEDTMLTRVLTGMEESGPRVKLATHMVAAEA